MRAVVHHINGVKADNRTCNLVICQDEDYHRLLHKRARALAACGNPNWRPCMHCGQYDDPARLRGRGRNMYHGSCARIRDHGRGK